MLRKACAENLLLVPAEIAGVDPHRVRNATGCGDGRIATEADDVAERVHARVLPENLGARRIAGGTERFCPRAAVAGVGAGEPRLLPTLVAARVVEAGPKPSCRRVERRRGPEPIRRGIGAADRTARDALQLGIENPDVHALRLAGPADAVCHEH